MTTRRDLCLSLPAFALLGEAMSQAAAAQVATAAQESKPDLAKIARGTAIFQDNHVFRASEMPVRNGPTGSSQAVIQGVLPTGEGVEMHNTVLNPGMAPHPPHQHMHSEWLFLREGDVEWMVDGVWQKATGGDILFASSMKMHGLRNVGSLPARYFVMAVGPNLKG